MRKSVVVLIILFLLFFLIHQILNPIWDKMNSQPSPFNTSARFMRYKKLKDASRENDKSNDAGEIEDFEIQRDDDKNYHDFKDKELIKHAHEHVNNGNFVDKDKDGGGDENDNELEESEVREYLRLKHSPYIVHEDEEEKMLSSPPKMSGVKLVSEWKLPTPFHNSFDACRYNQCKWVANNSIADAVMFRASSVRNWVIKPFYRKPGQRWVLYTADPAAKMFRLEGSDVANQFNATVTYQLDSDYPRIFGRLQKVKPPAKDYDKIFAGKTKSIAWFVSHCKTWGKRELYIERMRKIIPVDIFGACGNLTCAGSDHRKEQDKEVCLPMLSQHYKFYLSFENSLCKDYVTEKFFKLFQDIDVIPVVRGGFNYKKNLPSTVFIDAADFKTPEDLAHYLLKLSKDKSRYTKMLKRKARWTFRPEQSRQCVLCEGLHKDRRTHHFYLDLFAKFNGRPSHCYDPDWLGK